MEETADLERLCEATSPDDERCTRVATVHCPNCGSWFCDAHAEDDGWHECMKGEVEEGGEA